jgi:hypothetical protein
MDGSQRDLWERFIRNECTTAEIEALLTQFNNAANETDLLMLIEAELHKEAAQIDPALPDLEQKEKEIYAALLPHILMERKPSLWPRIAAAASIVVLLGFGGYFALHKKHTSAQLVQNHIQIISPGQNRATLTLANGQKIVLAKGLKGQLAVQGGTVIQASDNDITYNITDKEETVSYNILSTAKGEQSPYPLILADGTKVWLDAASSITFPTAFTGKQRKVRLTGQGYFEVSHNPAMPFIVETSKSEVQVLGTHFNVSAYADDQETKTTLLEGSVRIKGKTATGILKPGEQAVLTDNDRLSIIKDVDTETAVAWKNGLFVFKNASIEQVMMNASRWYDINIKYEGNVPKRKLNGRMSRAADISELLGILQFGGIKYRIEGKNIIVAN